MRRIPELDSLRGLAALGIVLFHAFPFAFFFGWSCVDLFFVLSGYLISTIILENISKRGFLKTFYFRRILRIWPVYYLTLAAVLILNSLTRQGYPTDGWFWNCVFLQNVQHYWKGQVPPFIATFDNSWSVAIEEQFYLLWPFLLIALGRKGAPWLAGFLILLSVAFRALDFSPYILFGRFDGLALGCLLAIILFEPAMATMKANMGSPPAKSCPPTFVALHPPQATPCNELTPLPTACYDARHELPGNEGNKIVLGFVALGLTSVVAIAVANWVHWGVPYPRWPALIFLIYGLFFFSIIGLTVRFSGHRWLWPLRWRGLRFLGLISYSLYMFHAPIFSYVPAILNRLDMHSPILVHGALWTALFGLPALSYFFIERPILTLKSRMEYGSDKPDLKPAVATATSELIAAAPPAANPR